MFLSTILMALERGELLERAKKESAGELSFLHPIQDARVVFLPGWPFDRYNTVVLHRTYPIPVLISLGAISGAPGN
jgi:hypothetical protein